MIGIKPAAKEEKMEEQRIRDAKERAQMIANALRVAPPKKLIAKDGAPSDSLLRFCEETGASLDFIFRDPQGSCDMTPGQLSRYREAAGEVEFSLIMASGIATALYAIANEYDGTSNLDPTANAIMSLIRSLDERLREATELQEAEWNAVFRPPHVIEAAA